MDWNFISILFLSQTHDYIPVCHVSSATARWRPVNFAKRKKNILPNTPLSYDMIDMWTLCGWFIFHIHVWNLQQERILLSLHQFFGKYRYVICRIRHFLWMTSIFYRIVLISLQKLSAWYWMDSVYFVEKSKWLLVRK